MYICELSKMEIETDRNQLKASALTAWRTELILRNMFGGEFSPTYNEYLNFLGLLSESEKAQEKDMKSLQQIASDARDKQREGLLNQIADAGRINYTEEKPTRPH